MKKLLFVLLLASTSLFGQQAYSVRTDRTFVAESVPSLCSSAPCNMTVSNLNSGTVYTRVTDANTRPDRPGRNWYPNGSSEIDSWNSTSTEFLVEGDGGENLVFVLNPANQTVARIPCTAAVGNDCGDSGTSGGLIILDVNADAEYSNSSPHVIYGTSTSFIKSVDYSSTIANPAVAPVVTTIANAATCTNLPSVAFNTAGFNTNRANTRFQTNYGGGQDNNTVVYVFDSTVGCRWFNTANGTMGGAWGPLGAVAYKDGSGSSTAWTNYSTIHNTRMSKDGNWIRITNQTTTNVDIWNVATNDVYKCTPGSPGYCEGHLALGFGGQLVNITGGDVVSTTLAQTRVLPPPVPFTGLITNFTAGTFGSDAYPNMNNQQAGIANPVMACITSQVPPTAAWQDELLGLSQGGSNVVYRFGFAYTRAGSVGGDFQAAIHCNASRNGRWVLFSSNWGTSLGRTDAYVIALPFASSTLNVTPTTATIPISGTQQFSGSIGGGTWSLNSGCAGSVNSATGIFTATSTVESCIVTDTVSAQTASATVNVSAFTISPTAVSLTVGGTQQFSANFSSSWSADAGVISGSGLYTAPNANGTYHVTATAINGGTTATATITVTGQQTFIPLSTSPIAWNTTTTAGAPVSQVFTISNVGTGSVTPTVGLTGTGYSITANTCSGAIVGGGTCAVTVQFSSSTIQFFSGRLLITDSAGGSQSIPLGVNIPNPATFHIDPTNSTIPINTTLQMVPNLPAYCFTDFGTIDNACLFFAPGTAGTATVTATQQTIIAADQNLQPITIWHNCGNCGNTGGPSTDPHGTFTITAGDPEIFTIAPAGAFDNFFWWIVLGSPGDYNSTVDFTLSFDMQFPTQADKNASQAIEFELQKNVLDHQYSMAWQICFACGNKLRVFNKTAHAWEDSGLTVNPADFAGGKWVSIQTVYELTTGSNTRHVSIAINGVNHVVNIDHIPTPAVESDYLHPAFQMDANSSGTPYKVWVRRFTIGSQTSTTATATVNVTDVVPNAISPKTVTVPIFGAQQFTASASSTWTKSCGTLSATTGTSVIWSAPVTAQTCTVTATNGSGGVDTATVTVVAVAISPSSATMQINSNQQFTANVPVTWSIASGSCTVSTTGLVRSPGSNGSCSVLATAQNGGSTATASVSVVGAPSSTSGTEIKSSTLEGGSIH